MPPGKDSDDNDTVGLNTTKKGAGEKKRPPRHSNSTTPPQSVPLNDTPEGTTPARLSKGSSTADVRARSVSPNRRTTAPPGTLVNARYSSWNTPDNVVVGEGAEAQQHVLDTAQGVDGQHGNKRHGSVLWFSRGTSPQHSAPAAAAAAAKPVLTDAQRMGIDRFIERDGEEEFHSLLLRKYMTKHRNTIHRKAHGDHHGHHKKPPPPARPRAQKRHQQGASAAGGAKHQHQPPADHPTKKRPSQQANNLESIRESKTMDEGEDSSTVTVGATPETDGGASGSGSVATSLSSTQTTEEGDSSSSSRTGLLELTALSTSDPALADDLRTTRDSKAFHDHHSRLQKEDSVSFNEPLSAVGDPTRRLSGFNAVRSLMSGRFSHASSEEEARRRRLTSMQRYDSFIQRHQNSWWLNKRMQVFVKWQLHPDRSRLVKVLAFLTLASMCYTAIVVPFEAAFLMPEYPPHTVEDSDSTDTARFTLSRFVDLVYILDIAISFLTPYRTKQTITYEYNPAFIARHYLNGWFKIDILAVLPYFLIYSPPGIFNLYSSSDLEQGGEPHAALRLLRMFKLLKLLKFPYTLKRLYSNRLDSKDIYIAILGNFALFCMIVHWMSCVWILVAEVHREWGNDVDDNNEFAGTWVEAAADNKDLGEKVLEHPDKARMTIYLASMHFAVMTITTVGYGDISPVNRGELIVAIVMQIFGAFCNNYILAVIMSLVSVVDGALWTYVRRVNDLNKMLRRIDLPIESKARMRMYLFTARHYLDRKGQRDVCTLMSPPMQSEIYHAEYGTALSKLTYFRTVSHTFIVSVCKVIRPIFYAPQDQFATPATLFVIANNGLVAHEGKIFSRHSAIGSDFMVSNLRLKWMSAAIVLTFTETLTLHRAALEELMLQFPDDAKHVSRAAHWIALKRYLIVWASSVLKVMRAQSFWTETAGSSFNDADATRERQQALRDGESGSDYYDDEPDTPNSGDGDRPHRARIDRMSTFEAMSEWLEVSTGDNVGADPVLEQRRRAREDLEWLKTNVNYLMGRWEETAVQIGEVEQKLDILLDLQHGGGGRSGSTGRSGGGTNRG